MTRFWASLFCFGALPSLSGGMHGIPRHGVSMPEKRDTRDDAVNNNQNRDLVFVHVPYNFGHTIEKVLAFGSGSFARAKFAVLYVKSKDQNASLDSTESEMEEYGSLVNKMTGKDATLWGMMEPMLHGTSSVGCPTYLTPPKHWPDQLAKEYIGNRSSFGMLRDPYERLVAIFRGSAGGETGSGYGGDYQKYSDTCDVDGAVRQMLAKVQEDPFAEGCTFLPQSEYFDGDLGIKIPVDNRMFPMSVNTVLQEHGYGEEVIKSKDIEHVSGCTEVWSAALSPETRALVRKVYKRDFELLCENFGYCDDDESTCLQHVPGMCPKNMTKV